METLTNDKMRQHFLKFTTESLCPENLLFWIDVHFKYESCDDSKLKLLIAKNIVQQYLLPESLMELNLDSKLTSSLSQELKQTIQVAETALLTSSAGSELPTDLFNNYKKHVEFDLLDSFSRFVFTAEYQSYILSLEPESKHAVAAKKAHKHNSLFSWFVRYCCK